MKILNKFDWPKWKYIIVVDFLYSWILLSRTLKGDRIMVQVKKCPS